MLNPSLEQRFSTALRTRLYAAIVSARWSFLVGRRSTDLVHATTAEIDRISTGGVPVVDAAVGVGGHRGVHRHRASAVVLVDDPGGAGRRGPALDVPGAHAASRPIAAPITRTSAATCFTWHRSPLRDSRLPRASAPRRATSRSSPGLRGTGRTAISTCCERLPRPRCAWTCRAPSSSAFFVFVAVEGLELRGAGLLVMLFVFARIMPRAMALQESAQMFVTGLPAFSSVMHLIDQCEAEAEDLGSSDSTRIGVTPGRALRVGVVSLHRLTDRSCSTTCRSRFRRAEPRPSSAPRALASRRWRTC